MTNFAEIWNQREEADGDIYAAFIDKMKRAGALKQSPKHMLQRSTPLGHALRVGGGLAAGLAVAAVVLPRLLPRVGRAWANLNVTGKTRNIMSALEGVEAADGEESDEEDEFLVDDGETEEQALLRRMAAVKVPGGVDGAEQTPAVAAQSLRARRHRVRRPEIRFGRYQLTGRAAEVAQRAKLAYGGVPRTDYNRQSVKRWLNKELKQVAGTRTADLLKWLPIMELYVFYITDADKDLDEVIEELETMGRIRRGAP
jgi:hypothetical protein